MLLNQQTASLSAMVPGNPYKLLSLLLCLIWAGCLGSKSDNGNRNAATESHQAQESSTAPPTIEPSILANRTFQEAPMLAEKVHSGKLPPVSERLPENPLVLVPVEEIGTYGGTLRRAMETDIINESTVSRTFSESLMAFERPLPNSPQLNLAESYEFIDEGRSLVVKLRKGIKWSDGEPFTVEDILFWYEDMTLDENARTASNNPLFPARWRNGGKPVRMEKVDDFTLKISSHKPLGKILETLCHDDIAIPKHVFAQYHPKYNAKSDYDEFRRRTTDGMLAFEPGIPRLSAWVPVKWERSQKAVYERNPYYWKVDTKGNQLPYTDRFEFPIVPNTDLIQLKFLNGEVDLLLGTYQANAYSFLKSKVRGGVFKLHLAQVTPSYAFFPNWDAPNPLLREALRNKNVRIALSHALNRDEISQLIFDGLLQPGGFSFSHAGPFYSAELAQLYSQYDPDKSRQLLDQSGYSDSDGNGYREFKDGSVFSITLDVLSGTIYPDLSELAAAHWEAIGIKINLNIALQEIIIPRRYNGEFEVLIKDMPTHPLTQSHNLVNVGPNLPFWHQKAAQEAPPWMRQVTADIKEAQVTLEADKLAVYTERIRDLFSENIPFISIGAHSQAWGSNKRLGNVPDLVNREDLYRGNERVIIPEQIYIKN